MNELRFRYWFLSAPITLGVVGVMIEWAIYTHQDTSSFYVLTGLIGFFVLGICTYGGEKLYQKYKDRS